MVCLKENNFSTLLYYNNSSLKFEYMATQP